MAESKIYSPFGPRRTDPPRERQKIIGFIGSVCALCTCGAPEVMMIPVIPGASAGITCGRCETQWVVTEIQYDAHVADPESPETLKIFLTKATPRVAIADGPLPAAPIQS